MNQDPNIWLINNIDLIIYLGCGVGQREIESSGDECIMNLYTIKNGRQSE